MTYFVRFNTWFLLIIISTKGSYSAASRQENFKNSQDYFVIQNFKTDGHPTRMENKMNDNNIFKVEEKQRLKRDILENPEDQLDGDMPDSPVRNDAAQLHFFSWFKGSRKNQYKKNRNVTITPKIAVQNIKPTASLGALRVNANSSNSLVSTTAIPAKSSVMSTQSRTTAGKTTADVYSTLSYLTTCYTITDTCANNMPLISASNCTKDSSNTASSSNNGETASTSLGTTTGVENGFGTITVSKKSTNSPSGKTQGVPVNSVPLGAFDGLIIPIYQIPLSSPLNQESENETSRTLINETLGKIGSTESSAIFEKEMKRLSITPQMLDVISSSLMNSEIEKPPKVINFTPTPLPTHKKGVMNFTSAENNSSKKFQKGNLSYNSTAGYVTKSVDWSIQNLNPNETNFSEMTSVKNSFSEKSKIEALTKKSGSDKEKNMKLLNVWMEKYNYLQQNKTKNISHNTLEKPSGMDLHATNMNSKEINISEGKFSNDFPHLENFELTYPEVFRNPENISYTQNDEQSNIIHIPQASNENITHLRQFDLGNPVPKPSVSLKEGDLTSPLPSQNFLFAGTMQFLTESINPVKTENVTVINPFHMQNIILQKNTNIPGQSQPYVLNPLNWESLSERNQSLLQNELSTGSLLLKENLGMTDANIVKNNLSQIQIMKNNIEKVSLENQISKNQSSISNPLANNKNTIIAQNNLLQVESTHNSPLNIENNTKAEEFYQMNPVKNISNYARNDSSLQNNIVQSDSNNDLHIFQHSNVSSPSNVNIDFTDNSSFPKSEMVYDFSIKSNKKMHENLPLKSSFPNQVTALNKENLDKFSITSVSNNISSNGTQLEFPLMAENITQTLSNNPVPLKQSFKKASSIENNKTNTLKFPNIANDNTEINIFNYLSNDFVRENVFIDSNSVPEAEIISDNPILMTPLTNLSPSFEENNTTTNARSNVSQVLRDISQAVSIFDSPLKNISSSCRLTILSDKSLLSNETENLPHGSIDSSGMLYNALFPVNFVLNPKASLPEIIAFRSPNPLVSLLEETIDTSNVSNLQSNISSAEIPMDFPIIEYISKTDPVVLNTNDGLDPESIINKSSQSLQDDLLKDEVIVSAPLESEKTSHTNTDSHLINSFNLLNENNDLSNGSSQSSHKQFNVLIENKISPQKNKPSAEILVNIPSDSLLEINDSLNNSSLQKRICQTGDLYNPLKVEIIAQLDTSNRMNSVNSNTQKEVLESTKSDLIATNISELKENSFMKLTNTKQKSLEYPENLNQNNILNDININPINSKLFISDITEDKIMMGPDKKTENSTLNNSQRNTLLYSSTATENINILPFRNVPNFTENITSQLSGFGNIISADNVSNNEQIYSESQNSLNNIQLQGNLSSLNDYRLQRNIYFVENPNFQFTEYIKPENEIGTLEKVQIEQPLNIIQTPAENHNKFNLLADIAHLAESTIEDRNCGNDLTIYCKPKESIKEFEKTLKNEILYSTMHFANASLNRSALQDNKNVKNLEYIVASTDKANVNGGYLNRYTEFQEEMTEGRFMGKQFNNTPKEILKEYNTIHFPQLQNLKGEIKEYSREPQRSSEDYKSDMQGDLDKNIHSCKTNDNIRLQEKQLHDSQLIGISSFKEKVSLPKVKNDLKQGIEINFRQNNDSVKEKIDDSYSSTVQLTDYLLPTNAFDEYRNKLNSLENKITGYEKNFDDGQASINEYSESCNNLTCSNPVKIYFKYNDSFLAQQSLNGQNLLEICKNVTCQGDNILTPCCGSKQICPPFKCKGEDLSYLLPIPGLTSTTTFSPTSSVKNKIFANSQNKDKKLNAYVRVARDNTLNDLVRFHLMHGISAPDEKDLMNALREVNFQVQKVNREFHPELAAANPVILNLGESKIFQKNLENMPQLVDTSKILGNINSPLVDTRLNTQLGQNNEGKFRTIRNYGSNEQVENLKESNILGRLRNQAEQKARQILELEIKRKEEEEKFLKQKEDNLKQLKAIQELQEKEYEKMSEDHKNNPSYTAITSNYAKLKNDSYSKLVRQIQKCDTMKDIKDLLFDRYSELQGNVSNYANNVNFVPQPNSVDTSLHEKKLSDLGLCSNINRLSLPVVKVEYSENVHHDEIPKRVKRKCKRSKKENIIFLNEGSKGKAKIPDIRDFKETFNSLYNDLSNLEKYITSIEQHSQIVAEANENPYIINNSSIMKLNKER